MKDSNEIRRVPFCAPMPKPQKATLGPVVTAAQWPIFRGVARSIVELESTEADTTGTGCILTTNGCILTCEHVLNGGKKFVVTRFRLDKKTYRLVPLKRHFVGQVIFADKKLDIAVLKVDKPPRGLKPITFGNSDLLKNGMALYRIGRDVIPLSSGYVIGFGYDFIMPSVKVGMLAAPGASGGPLCDNNGAMLGMIQRAQPDAEEPPYACALPLQTIIQRLRNAEEIAPFMIFP
jgi:hypothetical protein